jgi:uncharacterized membrane protein
MEPMAEREKRFHALFAVFDREHEAGEVLTHVRRLAEAGRTELQDAAALRRDPDLSLRMTRCSGSSEDSGTQAMDLLTAIVPFSLFVRDALGARAEVAQGRGCGAGFEHQDLVSTVEGLRPGQSAFIAVVRDDLVDQVVWAVQGYTKLDEYYLDVERGQMVAV